MNTSVEIVAWQNGLNKVELNHLLRAHGNLGLKDAKDKVDQLLLGQRIHIEFGSADGAKAFADQASAIGAICRIE